MIKKAACTIDAKVDVISRSPCSVCLRSVAVTSAGLIRQHGPVQAHCSGSHQPSASSFLILPPFAPPITLRVEVPSPAPSATTQAALPAAAFSRPTVKILRRILKASRLLAGRKLTSLLEAVVFGNDHTLWKRLFHFSSHCLKLPQRSAQGTSLATLVNRQIRQRQICQISKPALVPREATTCEGLD